jgi:glucose/arabinose dehydrogenase
MSEIDRERNWWVFPGFEIELVATGFDLPVNIAFVPDPGTDPDAPLFYVTELYGQVKVVTNNREVHTCATGLLNYEPDYNFPGTGESGLTGICVEPETGDLFLSMLYDDKGSPKSKVIRAKSKAGGLEMASTESVLEDVPSIRAAHQIQAVTIGFDGKLYVNFGDGLVDPNTAQDDKDIRGKILRLNLDGSVPSDNPNSGSSIFAKGLRNPFGATWRKSNQSLYVSDNGPAYDDRIARVDAGNNYGWPNSMRTNSIFWWEFTQAPTALAFMQDREFPPVYHDQLFVALFGGANAKGRSPKGKKIVKLLLSPDDSGVMSHDSFVVYVGEGPASPCGLAFGPGGLYFTDLFGELDIPAKAPVGNVYRVSPVGRVPDTPENFAKCICMNCPTHNACMKERKHGLFCARDKTDCDFVRMGCICGECPIATNYRLTDYYYCDIGSA